MKMKKRIFIKLRAAVIVITLLLYLLPNQAALALGGTAPVIIYNETLTVSGSSAVLLPAYLSAYDDDAVTLAYTLLTPPRKGSLYNSYSNSIISVNGTFTQADINAGYISYLPFPAVSGEDSFSFRVSDGVNSTTGIFRLYLNAVNQAPVLSVNSVLSVNEGETTAITNNILRVTDAEQGAAELRYTVTAAPQYGKLYKNNTVLNTGASFTQEDIDLIKVFYKQVGGESELDFISFQVSDGHGGSIQDVVLKIALRQLNNAPKITVNAGLTVDEDSGLTSITNKMLRTTDSDSVTLCYRLTSVPSKGTLYKEGIIMNAFNNSKFTQADIDAGLISFMPLPDKSGQDSISFTVSDGVNEIAGVFHIYIIPKNDPPYIVSNRGLSIYEGDSQAITKTLLEVADTDQTSAEIYFTLTKAPSNGKLYKRNAELYNNSTFTQEDINNGSLLYKHDGSETTKDSFSFTVSDGAGGSLPTSTFNISITLVDDPPVLDTDNGLIVNENSDYAPLSFKVTDPEGKPVLITVASLPAKGSLTYKNNGAAVRVGDSLKQEDINAGILRYKPGLNENGSDSFSIRASDGKVSTVLTVGITIRPVNDPPGIISSKSARWVSGKSGIVYTAKGSDPDGDELRWSISGTDAKLFSIDSESGQLRFITAPDYYKPGDKDLNNKYELILTASDGKLSVDMPLTIIVDPSAYSGAGEENHTAAVLIDGVKHSMGSYKTGREPDGRDSVEMLIGSEDIKELSGSLKQGSVITVSMPFGFDKYSLELKGDIVLALEEQDALLHMETGLATYMLPASQIGIGAAAQRLGADNLKDISVSIAISRTDDKLSSKAENTAQKSGINIMIPAVDFIVLCSFESSSFNVDTFGAYINRLLPLPDDVEPEDINTGVIVEASGDIYPVPTQLVTINGKKYVKISSMTNSTYTLVSKKVEFTDLKGHWASYEINDMGSRLIINGMGNNRFEPDKYMTRAQFATVIVKALGLAPGMGSCQFTDVKSGEWYKGYIETAVEYGLIYGYGDGTFGPNETITREQAATMIARAMKLVGLSVKLDSNSISQMMTLYKDGFDTSRYAGESVAICLYYNLISGRSDNRLAPKEEITRAEVAVMVQRMLVKANLI